MKRTIKQRSALACAAVLLACVGVTAAAAHGMPGDHVHALQHGGPWTYLWSGAVHMLTGYDHLLFLFGVMFFLTTTRDIVSFVSVFTIGHSVTLIAATLLGIKANPYLIDAVIAGSVIYKGFENFDGFKRWIGIPAPPALWMVGCFGLAHGFGLATRVQNYGFPSDGLLVRLFAFNVGVELGQIVALIGMVAALAVLRNTTAFAPFATISNAFLVAAGSLLFLHQLHGFQHTAWPDEFGFSSRGHIIDHFTSDIPTSGTNSKVLDMSPDQPVQPK